MAKFRIYRMKETPRQQFRFAPHVSGCANVKPRDYEQKGETEAANEYDAWLLLRSSEQPLDVGDLLENENSELRICKYVGFESAQWILPEVKSGAESAPAADGPPAQGN